MKKILIILFLGPLFLFAQEVGIHFEHNTDWQKIKAKAKAEDKFIFVDCYTTWCGPCIWMANNVFPQEKVGNFFNKNFVNLKIQMDETKKDSEDVMAWYPVAKKFMTDYSIRAFPTFLFFNPDGELVHRIVGGADADDFIAKAGDALSPETQYVTLTKAYELNPNDEKIAQNMANAAFAAFEEDLALKAMTSYLQVASVDKVLTKENLNLIQYGTNSTTSPMYAMVRDNMDLVNMLFEEGGLHRNANELLVNVLLGELVSPQIYSNSNEEPDFKGLEMKISKEHPYVQLAEGMKLTKIHYFINKQNWTAFKDAVNDYLKDTKSDLSPEMLNQFAYIIFKNCDDPACLNAALTWSKKSLEMGEIAAYLDTYANLLYKSGDTKNAIIWQEKAIKAGSDQEKGVLQNALVKMQSGKPTWN